MPVLGINSCPSLVSKPQTPFQRTSGSRNHGQHQRPQQARWEFRRWDGALFLKAAGAPAEQQTQHGIAETRFENSQHHREPCLVSVYPGGVWCDPLRSGLGLGKRCSQFLGVRLLACDALLMGWAGSTVEGSGCSMRQQSWP